MKKLLLNAKWVQEILINKKIVIVDGGARGDLFGPFDQVNNKIINVLRFEADADAVMSESSNFTIFPNALWKENAQIDINIAIEPSTSSVYPFNTELQKFIDPFKYLRKVEKTVKVDAMSLDNLVQMNNLDDIDFIKLDIHGAEYEVLEGSKSVLQKTLGVLAETWIIPIHLGQKTRGDVESLLLSRGFYVFEEKPVSEWVRMPKDFLKRQPVGVDTLFFKDVLISKEKLDLAQAIKLIGFAELFGHYGYAFQLVDHFLNNKMIEQKWYNLIIDHLSKNCKISLSDKINYKLSQLGSLFRARASFNW